MKTRTKVAVLDDDFGDARSKLLEVSAFIDRVERGDGEGDYRYEAYRKAIQELLLPQPGRTEAVLTVFSDPTTEPLPVATVKSAAGAWQEFSR